MKFFSRRDFGAATGFLIFLFFLTPLGTQAAHRGTAGQGQATYRAAATSSGTQTLVCVPEESAVATAPAPAPAPSANSSPTQAPAPAPSASPSPTSSSGYAIAVQSEQTSDGTMAAVIYYATPPAGRTPVAGFADVSKVPPADASVALELKSTDQSPFRFDLTVGTAPSGSAYREATLVQADLFSDGTLTSLPYKCKVER